MRIERVIRRDEDHAARDGVEAPHADHSPSALHPAEEHGGGQWMVMSARDANARLS